MHNSKGTEQINFSSLAELNRFEEHVSQAVFTDGKEFKQLLYRCRHLELTPNQTSRILVVCRTYERTHLTTKLRFCRDRKTLNSLYSLAAVKHTAKVATLLGVVHYLGAGIEQDDALAKHYFELATSLDQKDAWVFLGLMARKGQGQPGNKPNYSRAWQYFQRALDGDINPEAHFQQAEMFLSGEVSKSSLKDSHLFGFSAVKNILQGGVEESQRLEINLGLRREIDIQQLLSAIDQLELKYKTERNDVLFSNETAIEEFVKQTASKIKPKISSINQDYIMKRGDPYGLVVLSLSTIKKANQGNAQVKFAAQCLHRAYLTYSRLRQEPECEATKKQFIALMSDSTLNEHHEYGFIVYSYNICVSQELLIEQSAFQGFDLIIRFYLLNDNITSRRERMRWILLLLDSQLPEQFSLSGKALERKGELRSLLYDFGILAIEAVDDCLELAAHLDGTPKDHVIVEAKKFWLFANILQKELRSDELGNSENQANSQRLSNYYDEILNNRLSDLLGVRTGNPINISGLTAALHFLMGSSSGDSQLELIQDPILGYYSYWLLKQCDLFHAIQKKRSLSYYERQKIIDYLVIISAVPVDKRNDRIRTEIGVLCGQLNVSSMRPQSETLILGNAVNCQNDFLKKVQDFFHFCRLIECAPFGEKTNDEYSHLFEVYQRNRSLIGILNIALKEFNSYDNQPSSSYFFSATYGMENEFRTELDNIKVLLQRCESTIFDEVELARKISQYINMKPENCYSIRFLEIFMKHCINRLNYSIDIRGLTFEVALSRFRNAFEGQHLPSDINSVSDFSL